jgi:hypothetical protein
MMLFAIICLVCALIPCVLFLFNLLEYRVPPPPRSDERLPRVSVLIPARNEAANIARAVESVLANTGVEFELLVLDDHSTDSTAAIVQGFAARDSRVRLETAPPLPQGWCGKQHACAALAERARFPLLVFMDADVRLAPDALARMASWITQQGVALASGVPRQTVVGFWERLLIPLIHFVLLGLLPMRRMRRTTKPAYAAGCGQLFIARADAYRATGGHACIRASLHDGLNLPRTFRTRGFRTGLFDATPVAECRMYASVNAVFGGLAKNAVEGLAAPARIVPITLLLGFGQVAPLLLLLSSPAGSLPGKLAWAALLASMLPRLIAAFRFRQPLSSVVLHPLGMAVLLGIQWFALLRSWAGGASEWRGRTYGPARTASALLLASVCLLGAGEAHQRLGDFQLKDQFNKAHVFQFPRSNATFLIVADHKGSEQIDGWVRPVQQQFGRRVTIAGVADVSSVPPGLRGFVQRGFVKKLSYPVMLDWKGEVVRALRPEKNCANAYLLGTNGMVLHRWSGQASESSMRDVIACLAKQAGDRQPLPKAANITQP